MKISTKIIIGYGVLIALIAAMPAYEFYTIVGMKSVIYRLSAANFPAGRSAVDLAQELENIENLAWKLFTTVDRRYADRMREFMDAFQDKIRGYKELAKSKQEQAILVSLESEWNEFREELRNEVNDLPPGGLENLPEPLQAHLTSLNEKIGAAFKATKDAIDLEVQQLRLAGRRAVIITSCVTALAFLTSVVVSIFLVRSITTPLKQLTVGTRRITEGQFDYRLETSAGDEFAQLARDFNLMTRRLNELDQMKRDFVSHVSHELKAPLASIRESLQLMLEELPGPLNAKQKRLIEINLTCARRLSSMLGNLLDLSRMDAGMMEYQLKPNDIVALTLTAIEEYEPQAREKNLRLVAALPEIGLPVHCDGDRIIQVIGNVLGNAIKFSPTGGRIEIRAQALPSLPRRLPESWRRVLSKNSGNGSYVTISISDVGPGIPDELKEKIFKKFQQLRQEKALTGPGVGLGLAISRTIMTAHQGAIWVEENEGGGSIFVMLLPAGSAGQGLIHTESAPI